MSSGDHQAESGGKILAAGDRPGPEAQQHLSVQHAQWKNAAHRLGAAGNTVGLSDRERVPRHPLEKPGTGCYHLVRFVRSDCQLNIFGERCSAPPETQYEYVVATIDVREKKLKLSLGPTQVAEYDYQLR